MRIQESTLSSSTPLGQTATFFVFLIPCMYGIYSIVLIPLIHYFVDYHRWSMFDPLVGAWLVDSEHPPNSFTDLLERYSVKDSCKVGGYIPGLCIYIYI